MKGFEIHINDKLVCAAGLPDDAYLALGAYKHQHEGMRLYVNGTVQVSEYRLDHYDWGKQFLSVGDKVVIRVVDLEKFDEPLEKHSSDPTQLGKNEEKMIDLMARYRVIAEMEGTDTLKQPVSEGVFCSFCGKSNVEQPKMVAGPGKIFICTECVSLCNDILISGGSWPRP